ncbi:MAG TPA: hypothetical protein VF008_30690 [Niastella sp.]
METLFRPAVNDLATSQVMTENDTNVASPQKPLHKTTFRITPIGLLIILNT